MTILVIVAVCIVLLVLAFLLPRLSIWPQEGVDKTLGAGQRAEREAELLRQQADSYSEQIVVDTRLLWEERQRLIEDIRALADDVLRTAEDAIDRVAMPQMISEEEALEEDGPPTEDDVPTTNEVELDVLPGGAGSDEDERPA